MRDRTQKLNKEREEKLKQQEEAIENERKLAEERRRREEEDKQVALRLQQEEERREETMRFTQQRRTLAEEQRRRWERTRQEQDENIARRMQEEELESREIPRRQPIRDVRMHHNPFSSQIFGGFQSVMDMDDVDEPDIFNFPSPSMFQPVFHFGNGNTILFPGMGDRGMSYEELLNLQPVSTPAKNRDQLPEYTFKKTEKTTEQKNTEAPPTDCSICLMEYNEGESVKSLPCTHRFHSACIDKWLSSHNTCPVCKTQVDS